ncbi:MAG: hypothetical protein K5651_01480, partial [Bacteroidales bacterium]|nr:hypothetical protein [Bacteroidales bacterium]
IMDAESTIDITFFPGDYYTVNQNRHYKTSVRVKKVFHTPVLKLVSSAKSVQSNPFLQETIPMTIESHIPVRSDLSVGLAATTLVLGQDLLIDGTTATELVIPAGKTSVDFNLQIAFKDQSGYAKQGSLSLSPGEGYEISGSSGSLSISLSDPVVDFSSLLLYAAQHDGAGYRFWQAIKTRSGEWEGNTGYTGLDMGVSSVGSNYLRNYRNMYDHPSFSCRANSSVSNFLRMPELFPNYRSSGDIKILDYGNDRDHRQFSPSDSVLRFVPTPGQALKGVIRIHKPRSFVAFIGDYESWQGNAGAVDWKTDSQQTGGNIFLSTHPAITGTVTLVLEKVEGTYDLTNTSQPILLTAWFRSSSEEFMNGFDTETYDVEQEDGLWKLQYKIWPHY